MFRASGSGVGRVGSVGVGAVREQSFLACHATEGSRARQLMASARLVARLALKASTFPQPQTPNPKHSNARSPKPNTL